jgi:hypothetical protein
MFTQEAMTSRNDPLDIEELAVTDISKRMTGHQNALHEGLMACYAVWLL